MVVEFVDRIRAIEKSKQATSVGGLSKAIFMFNICTKIIIALRSHESLYVCMYICDHRTRIYPKMYMANRNGNFWAIPLQTLSICGPSRVLKARRVPLYNCRNSSSR